MDLTEKLNASNRYNKWANQYQRIRGSGGHNKTFLLHTAKILLIPSTGMHMQCGPHAFQPSTLRIADQSFSEPFMIVALDASPNEKVPKS